LAALTCLGREILRGNVVDETSAAIVAEAYSNIATTNVTPYLELDRALFAVASHIEKKSLRNEKK
jgi:hypothetical protein